VWYRTLTFRIIDVAYKAFFILTVESRFQELFFKFHPRLFRVAYYILKDRSQAEDVCQEVFLKLWDVRSRWDTINSMEGYLLLMAKNKALDYLKEIKKEADVLMELKMDTISIRDSEDNSDSYRQKLEKAVSQLAPQCRLIFSLSRFENLTNDEIADYLAISKRTVETQISLALKRFRTDLKPVFFPLLFIALLLPLAG